MNTSNGNSDRPDLDKTSRALDDAALADVNGGNLDDIFRVVSDIARRVVPAVIPKASDALRAEVPLATPPTTGPTT